MFRYALSRFFYILWNTTHIFIYIYICILGYRKVLIITLKQFRYLNSNWLEVPLRRSKKWNKLRIRICIFKHKNTYQLKKLTLYFWNITALNWNVDPFRILFLKSPLVINFLKKWYQSLVMLLKMKTIAASIRKILFFRLWRN